MGPEECMAGRGPLALGIRLGMDTGDNRQGGSASDRTGGRNGDGNGARGVARDSNQCR